MRRDVYVHNDSGGLSILAADAVGAMIEDQRSDDMQFVTGFKALFLELYGDDSMPVRVVVDEPLSQEEDEQWLARASWRIDTSDGRLLIVGGFDPDVLADWRDDGGADDGRGVSVIDVPAGPLRIDLYAHVGSMNGRQILSEAGEPPGAAFRRSHPDRAFPLWLTQMLEFSSDEDPGHEDVWRDIPASVKSGALSIDPNSPSAIGFVVHVRAAADSPGQPPEGGWFARDANARVPARFPVGLPSATPDPNMESFRDRIFGTHTPPSPADAVSETMGIIESWSGDGMRKIKDNTPPVSIAAADAFWLYWIAALTSDSPPAFEYLVAPAGEWPRPEPTEHYAVIPKGKTMSALRPSIHTVGWGLWHGARHAASQLSTLPDGTIVDIAMAPREREDEAVDAAIGRALFEVAVRGGRLEVMEVSPPAISRDTIADAVDFVRELIVNHRITVRGGAEREAFDSAAAIYVPEEDRLIWDGDTVRLFEPDEREEILLATPVFRTRFGKHWTCDPIDN